MGLFDFFQDIAKVVSPITQVAGPLLGLVNPALGIATSTIGGAFNPFLPQQAPSSPSYGGIISQSPVGWVTPLGGAPIPQFAEQTEGFPMPQEVALPAAAGAGVIMGLTRTLALTISRLAARLGITVLSVAGLGRVGSRIWRSLAVFARRHPNISLISMLTALGLTIEEASEFIAWGSTRKRRRRGGISGRDLRISKRTIRRISSFQHDLASLRAGGIRRGSPRGIRGGGVSVVRAG